MEWANIVDLFRMENLVYWVVTMVVVILTTIKQFNKQEKNSDTKNDEIITNLQKIEKQNGKILSLLEMHGQDIMTLKKGVNILEHRVSRLEDSQVNIYKRIGGNSNDKSGNNSNNN